METLQPGDWVLTRDGGPQCLRWTCRDDKSQADLAADPSLAPVRIPAHAFGPGCPTCDTFVSPQHRILVASAQAQLLFGEDEVLAPAKALFRQTTAPTATSYVHLLFEAHHLVTANGLPMESFHPGDMAKSVLTERARESLFALHPDLRWAPDAWGPTARNCLRRREAQLLAA